MIFVSIMLLWIAIQLNAPFGIIFIGVATTGLYLFKAVLEFIVGFVKSSHKQDKS